MKHHGHYEVMSPDELLINIEAGCSLEFINSNFQRMKKKHYNDKRHQEKKLKKHGR